MEDNNMKVRFFRCKKCGNLVELINDGGGELICCGEPMQELKGNTTDAATEKHVPVVEKSGNSVVVKVGSVAHPMTPDHWIQWIVVVTKNEVLRKVLDPSDKPEAKFDCVGQPVTVYEYCNLHGLWKTEL
jgi:superoxide reductase